MKNRTRIIIFGVTTLLVIYLMSIRFEATTAIVFSLFMLTTIGLGWMVYAILTDTSGLSGKKFDDYFYEDGERRG